MPRKLVLSAMRCYHAWLSLKVHASLLNKTIYRVHTDLSYLRNQLAALLSLLSRKFFNMFLIYS